MKFIDRLNNLLLKSRYRLERVSRLEQVVIQQFGQSDSFTFIQIGANDGISFDDFYQVVTERNCTGLVVEPVAGYFNKLRDVYSAYENITPVNYGIHESESSVNIYRIDPALAPNSPDWVAGIASLDPDHYSKFDIPKEAVVVEEVQCIHLMQLIKMYDINNVDLLQIDTEGYDARIIAMIDFDIIQPSVIKFEHEHLKGDEVKSVRLLLEAQGYIVRKAGNDTIAVI